MGKKQEHIYPDGVVGLDKVAAANRIRADLLTPEEFGAMLDVSLHTIESWRRRGAAPTSFAWSAGSTTGSPTYRSGSKRMLHPLMEIWARAWGMLPPETSKSSTTPMTPEPSATPTSSPGPYEPLSSKLAPDPTLAGLVAKATGKTATTPADTISVRDYPSPPRSKMSWKRWYGARRMGLLRFEVWVRKTAGDVYYKAVPHRFLTAGSAERVATALQEAYNDGLWVGSNGELPPPGVL